MSEQILKKIAGRIPETTRNGNQFERHPTTHKKTIILFYFPPIL